MEQKRLCVYDSLVQVQVMNPQEKLHPAAPC